jgi:small redox-active disulfide protein 2
MPEKVRVQVLGVGCSKCKALEEKIRSLAARHRLSIDIEKVSDLHEIMKYGIMMTPGLVIDGVLKNYGNIPTDDQLLKWIKGAS